VPDRRLNGSPGGTMPSGTETQALSDGVQPEAVAPPGEAPIQEIDRRSFFRKPVGVVAAAIGGGLVLAGCDFTSAAFDRRIHLLKRLTYGATPAERDRIVALGETAWLNEQLAAASINTSAIDAKVAQLPPINMAPVDLFNTYLATDAKQAGQMLQHAALMRAVESPAQLQERMVEFWSDHFNVPFEDKQVILYKIIEDRTVIRPLALTSFKQLLVGSATSPAMGRYLDNYVSKVNGINENYGRELLELHTLGVGNYTEADVVSTARLLTGWSIDNATRTFKFKQAQNDPAPLTILGWTRPTTGNPFTHGVAFLQYLAMQPACAQFVCTKLARRFVADRPDPALVTAMVNAWMANDSQIAPVLRAMVAHSAFDASAGGKFRRPHDYISFGLRALRASVNASTNLSQIKKIAKQIDGMGNQPFEWPAPNGYPDVEGAWLNTGGLLCRWNWTSDVVARAFNLITYDTTALRQSLYGKAANAVYDAVGQYLLLEGVTDVGETMLNTQLGWTSTMQPTNAQIDAALPTILVAVLGAADAQYR
jgi:uncharacterized protein (DUF1800 family)